MHEAALVVDIVIDGRVDAAEALCVADIFEVEQEIFAPRELRVAADLVFADTSIARDRIKRLPTYPPNTVRRYS